MDHATPPPAPAPDATPLLSAQQLWRRYRRPGRPPVEALSGVSFDLHRGETLGVVGESGCGKSTLARSLLALPEADAGEVLLQGQPLYRSSGATRRAWRHRLQMVFQDPMSSLNPAHRVREIVDTPLQLAGITDAATRQRRVRAALEGVGLDLALIGDRRPFELSGGQCQRVSLARALILQPDVLVCDEPVSALDVSVQAQVLNLLEDAKAAYGLSLVFIAHDLATVHCISDRVMVMYLGRNCEIGPTPAVFAAPRHPYTAALLAAMPSHLAGRPDRRAMLLPGEPPSPLALPSGCRFRNRCPRASQRCAQAVPELSPVASAAGHAVACHHPLTPPAGPEELEP